MNIKGFVISNEQVGIIQLSSPHSLPYLKFINDTVNETQWVISLHKLFFMRGISSSKFDDIFFE